MIDCSMMSMKISSSLLLSCLITTLLYSSSLARIASRTTTTSDLDNSIGSRNIDSTTDIKRYQRHYTVTTTSSSSTSGSLNHVLTVRSSYSLEKKPHRSLLAEANEEETRNGLVPVIPSQLQQNHRDLDTIQNCDSSSSVPFDLYFYLDSKPRETSFTLQCDNGKTYLRSDTYSNTYDAYRLVHDRVCLPATNDGWGAMLAVSCTLHVSDTGGDGTGKFQIYENGDLVHTYPGNIPFMGYDFCLGNNCGGSGGGGGGGSSFPIGGSGGGGGRGKQSNGNHESFPSALPDVVDWSAPCPPETEVDRINKQLHPGFFAPRALTFDLTFDANPKEVGYLLMCDNKYIWKVPPGTFGRRKAFQSIQQIVPSIAVDTTCLFVMYDSGGDGLMDDGGYNAGSFKLTYGTMTVANYVASSSSSFKMDGSGGPFSQLISCFGPKCNNQYLSDANGSTLPFYTTNEQNKGTVQAMSNTEASCTTVSLVLTTDEFPKETGYSLVCSGKKVWYAAPGSITEPFETISKTSCISDSCCTFTVSDTLGDGIISPKQNVPGSFELRWDHKSVASYDGSNPNAKFSDLSYQIGTCDE